MDRIYSARREAVFPFLIIILILFCWGPAAAATLVVCPADCNYTSIQDAIDAASAGDTIQIMNGTYTELIMVDKSLTLSGEDPAATIISGNYSGNVVTVIADDVEISGLTVTKGSTEYLPNMTFFAIGGIEIENLTVRSCIVTNSSVGIYADTVKDLLVSGTEVADCVSQGMLLENTTGTRIIGNIIHDNLYGIMTAWTETLTCRGNDIAHNQYSGLCLIDGVTDCIVEENQVRENCYLHFDETGSFNEAGAYFEFVKNSSCRNNLFLHNGGIAIFISEMKDSVLDGNTMEGNYAGFSYNDMNLYPGNTISLSNKVEGSPILYLEGASNQEIASGPYSCIYLVSCNNVSVHDLTLEDQNGLGITARGGSKIRVDRNTISHNIFQNILISLVSDGVITGNRVSDAAYGIGVMESVNVTVSGNTATGNGHGLAIASPCHLVRVAGNTANDNDVGISVEFATGDKKETGITCRENQITGSSTTRNLGIHLMDSKGIDVQKNNIQGMYEGVWVQGGQHNRISSQTIRNCTFGIELSLYTEGMGEGTPARNNVIEGNMVSTVRNAFFTDGAYPLVYENQVFLNSFISAQQPLVSSGTEAPAPADPASHPVAWGLSRSTSLARPDDAESAATAGQNQLNTTAPVIYRYQDRYFEGNLGNYWNWSTGTDTAGNGVRIIPYKVLTNNTDFFPLVEPASVYLAGPAPAFYANFTATPHEGASPLTVQFTDNSTGNPTRWLYTFGDGFSSSAPNPKYTYRAPGNYTVTLTIWKVEGRNLMNTTTVKPLYISVTRPPAPLLAANFTASPLVGTTPLMVAFTDLSTGSPDSWSYNFGDGSSSTQKNPTHIYRVPGAYTVNLTVIKFKNGELLKNTTSKLDLIVVQGAPVPVIAAHFTASPQNGSAPLRVTFTDVSTGNPEFWKYNFGDGTSSTARSPIHTYRSKGNYTVSLTVSKIYDGKFMSNTTVAKNLVSVY